MWKPDRTSKKPLYQQIANEMKHKIIAGEFPSGSCLPSERRLAELLEVNRSTVVQAYDQLRADGIVESRTGIGTIVSKHIWGIAPSLTPNWRQYVEGGTFAPNLPFIRRIREVLRGHDNIIDFASGELSNDLFPNKTLKQIMQTAPFEEHLGYVDPQGYLPLRETLTTFLHTHLKIDTNASSILITSGSQQSLYLITQCLLSPGDAIAMEDPSYAYSLPMFQSAGLHLFRLPVYSDGIDPEHVRNLFRQHRIRMLFLNPSFHNPTGSCLHASKRAQLLSIAAELGIPVIEDDPFSLTAFDHQPPNTLKSIDIHGSVLYIGSLSKIAASGLRIGWLVAPHSVVHRLSDARQQMDFGISVIPQWLAAQFLSTGLFEQHIRMLRDALFHKQAVMIRALEKQLPDLVSFVPAHGGLSLWCKIESEFNAYRLLEEAIKRGIVFMPGIVYGSEQDYVRLSYARPALEEIEPGIAKLAQALRSSLKK